MAVAADHSLPAGRLINYSRFWSARKCVILKRRRPRGYARTRNATPQQPDRLCFPYVPTELTPHACRADGRKPSACTWCPGPASQTSEASLPLRSTPLYMHVATAYWTPTSASCRARRPQLARFLSGYASSSFFGKVYVTTVRSQNYGRILREAETLEAKTVCRQMCVLSHACSLHVLRERKRMETI